MVDEFNDKGLVDHLKMRIVNDQNYWICWGVGVNKSVPFVCLVFAFLFAFLFALKAYAGFYVK